MLRNLIRARSHVSPFDLDVPCDIDEEERHCLSFWGFSVRNGQCSSVPQMLRCVDHYESRAASIIKDYLTALRHGLPRVPSSQQKVRPVPDLPWQTLLPYIPPSLLSLCKSLACRGAIMFNDPLSHRQMEELIQELSRCELP